MIRSATSLLLILLLAAVPLPTTAAEVDELLTRKELAEVLRLSLDGVDKLIHHPSDPIPCYKAGRRYLFKLDEVLEHLRVEPKKTPSRYR